jgi:uncharacterized membrane protein YhhN
VLPFVLLTAAALTGLLVAESRGFRPGIWVAKPLASTGFVAAALASGAATSTYGLWVLAALLLSMAGDVLLIPRGRPEIFRAGALSFLLGHLVFVGAFGVRGLEPGVCLVAAVLVSIPVLLTVRWLRPHLGDDMRATAYAYIVVISTMVVAAAGTTEPVILLGALLFYVSDLAVARERFVAPSSWNRAWGLPLYYAAQLVLASTVA